MLKDLDKLHENLLDFLLNDMIAHEKLLALLEKDEKELSNGNYREQHRKLNERMEIFANDFKEFK